MYGLWDQKQALQGLPSSYGRGGKIQLKTRIESPLGKKRMLKGAKLKLKR
eukprot:c28759_g1_i1 orf=42-191(+)